MVIRAVTVIQSYKDTSAETCEKSDILDNYICTIPVKLSFYSIYYFLFYLRITHFPSHASTLFFFYIISYLINCTFFSLVMVVPYYTF